MPDRFPPGYAQPVHASIAGATAAAPVTISAENGAGITIDGEATKQLSASRDILLMSSAQSDRVGVALVARQGQAEVGRSAPFAVADIPISVSVTDGGARNGHTPGAYSGVIVMKRMNIVSQNPAIVTMKA